MEEESSKGFPNRENHICKDRFEGSWHILGSARNRKCLKHRISVDAIVREGSREVKSSQSVRDHGYHSENLGNYHLWVTYSHMLYSG